MITVEELSYTYPGAKTPAVRGITFDIRPGEIFGFLGPSGAGKSTTQKVLIGLLKGYQGRVEVLGRPLSAWGQDYYEQIGVSFELPNHYLRLTALENLRYFASLYRRPAVDLRALLDQVGLGDAAERPVSQFSKGMKNRLNVARSLAHAPALVFLDEPTSGLDPVTTRLITDLIRRRRDEGATVFVTTHNMALANELCDRVAFMADGAIQLIDSPTALRRRYGQREVAVEYRNGGTAALQRSFALDTLGDDPEFLNILRSYRVEALHSQETTLEQIFITVTGKELSAS
jgi:fluoroquinolone transport system ATP-binding protein